MSLNEFTFLSRIPQMRKMRCCFSDKLLYVNMYVAFAITATIICIIYVILCSSQLIALMKMSYLHTWFLCSLILLMLLSNNRHTMCNCWKTKFIWDTVWVSSFVFQTSLSSYFYHFKDKYLFTWIISVLHQGNPSHNLSVPDTWLCVYQQIRCAFQAPQPAGRAFVGFPSLQK